MKKLMPGFFSPFTSSNLMASTPRKLRWDRENYRALHAKTSLVPHWLVIHTFISLLFSTYMRRKESVDLNMTSVPQL